MNQPLVSSQALPDFPVWEKLKAKRAPISFDLEVTARCNNNCSHCCINLPVGDLEAKAKELTLKEIIGIAQEAVSLGAVWCLLTGGEPLLRQDFFDLFLNLKRLGLLVSVFTNACLVTQKHVDLFLQHPPRDIEVTVYGITQETYERVTRQPGSFRLFWEGLRRLLEGGVKVRLKAMALQSNVHEFSEIARFCRQYSKDYFRFDPFLHLRFDGNPQRNQEIVAQRLSPDEIVSLERADPKRWPALEKNCHILITPGPTRDRCDHIFNCGAGLGSFAVSYDGLFRLCPDLWHPECLQDVKNGGLKGAWEDLVPRVREKRSQNREYLAKCSQCHLFNLCFWCPARAYLETGLLDAPIEYFCLVAHAREQTLSF
jgi:radical SAM protein with 4Fe4S-binding SPASM domain